MAENSKFYWLKLQKDFFKRHDIRIIEDMPNGKDYILFYLKLLVESITHEGSLRFSDAIPYNEQMLSTITNTNVDIVRSAMTVFADLGMIDVLEDKTIYMAEVSKMIGFETEWAKKKREYRDKKRTLSLECPPIVRQEKEIEIDIDINNICSAKQNESASNESKNASLEKLESDFALIYDLYPKKVGKAKAFARYKQWVSKSGRKVNGRTYHLTNKQIWLAVKKYVDLQQAKDTDLQYYKGFDVLMGDSLLDYLEEEQ